MHYFGVGRLGSDMGRLGALTRKSGPSAPLAPVPATATAAGYTRQLFFDDFTSLATVDVGGAHTGKNWYINNPENFIPAFGGPGPANIGVYTQANSVLSISSNTTDAHFDVFQNMSFYSANGLSYVSQVPIFTGSNGFYIEGSMQFTPNINEPGFWMSDINSLLEYMGGTAGSFRFGEIDVFQCNSGSPQLAAQAYHEWPANPASGIFTFENFTGNDFSKFHAWGALVVPMSLGGGTGSLTWFFDGIQCGPPVTWISTAGIGGAIESTNFALLFETYLNTVLNVDYIGVWGPHGGLTSSPTQTAWLTDDVIRGDWPRTASSTDPVVIYTGPNGWCSIRMNTSKSSGKSYIEIKCFASGSDTNYGFGFANSTFDAIPANGTDSRYLGTSTYSGGVFANGLAFVSAGFALGTGTLPGVAPVLNDVIGMLIDSTAGNIWVAKNNLNISTGATPNPSTDPPQLTFTPGTVGPLFPAMSAFHAGQEGSWIIQATSGSQTYTPPAGYSAWG